MQDLAVCRGWSSADNCGCSLFFSVWWDVKRGLKILKTNFYSSSLTFGIPSSVERLCGSLGFATASSCKQANKHVQSQIRGRYFHKYFQYLTLNYLHYCQFCYRTMFCVGGQQSFAYCSSGVATAAAFEFKLYGLEVLQRKSNYWGSSKLNLLRE